MDLISLSSIAKFDKFQSLYGTYINIIRLISFIIITVIALLKPAQTEEVLRGWTKKKSKDGKLEFLEFTESRMQGKMVKSQQRRSIDTKKMALRRPFCCICISAQRCSLSTSDPCRF